MGEKTEFEKLKKDLEKIKYVEKVDIEKTDETVLITIVDLSQDFLEIEGFNFFEQKRKLIKDIFKAFSDNNIRIEEEEFEDNDTYFYIVSYLN